MRFTIKSNIYPEMKLREVIDEAINQQNIADKIVVEGEPGLERGFEASVTIALVGTIGTLVGTLISGIISAMNSRKMQKIIIETNGNKIEVPSGISKGKLDELVSIIKQINDKDSEED